MRKELNYVYLELENKPESLDYEWSWIIEILNKKFEFNELNTNTVKDNNLKLNKEQNLYIDIHFGDWNSLQNNIILEVPKASSNNFDTFKVIYHKIWTVDPKTYTSPEGFMINQKWKQIINSIFNSDDKNVQLTEESQEEIKKTFIEQITNLRLDTLNNKN